MFKKLLLVIGIIGFLFLAIGSEDKGTATKESETEITKEENKKEEVKVFKIGDIIQLDKVLYTVNGVRESNGTNEYDKPKDGNKFFFVDVTIENKGKESENVSSMLMFKIQDSKAFTYNSIINSDQKGNVDGEISVGAKLRGELTFEVPSTETQLKLDVDPSVFGTGKFSVELY